MAKTKQGNYWSKASESAGKPVPNLKGNGPASVVNSSK